MRLAVTHGQMIVDANANCGSHTLRHGSLLRFFGQLNDQAATGRQQSAPLVTQAPLILLPTLLQYEREDCVGEGWPKRTNDQMQTGGCVRLNG